MTDRKTDAASREGSAEPHAGEADTPTRKSTPTKSGQEAAKGDLPAEHDHEHQSNYGGGGVNGGA